MGYRCSKILIQLKKHLAALILTLREKQTSKFCRSILHRSSEFSVVLHVSFFVPVKKVFSRRIPLANRSPSVSFTSANWKSSRLPCNVRAKHVTGSIGRPRRKIVITNALRCPLLQHQQEEAAAGGSIERKSAVFLPDLWFKLLRRAPVSFRVRMYSSYWRFSPDCIVVGLLWHCWVRWFCFPEASSSRSSRQTVGGRKSFVIASRRSNKEHQHQQRQQVSSP